MIHKLLIDFAYRLNNIVKEVKTRCVEPGCTVQIYLPLKSLTREQKIPLNMIM